MTTPRDADGPDRSDGRAFPSEAEWLSLPWPGDAQSRLPSRDFVDRVLRAVADDRALDRDLEAIDGDLPRIVMQSYEVPPPSPDFVDRLVSAARDDRRARWQHVLARHVAPEPTPAFVQRTLKALAADRERAPASGVRPGAWSRRAWWPVAIAAALCALLLLLRERPDSAAPGSLANPSLASTSPAMAHAFTGTSAAVLAAWADQHEPWALAGGAPDGVWLAFAEAR